MRTEREEVRSCDPMSDIGCGTSPSGQGVIAVAIDITFDFRAETTETETDPDAVSPTLYAYHQLLWSRALPSGERFDLKLSKGKPLTLLHSSARGEFRLTSDSVLLTFTRPGEMKHIVGQLPVGDIEALHTLAYTIGGMMLWPGVQSGGRTINQVRGFEPLIRDRFDLTVECVRRHYADDHAHPLAEVFGRYADFFALFVDFDGYVDFWLLHDLVDSSGSVRLFLPSEDFTLPSKPGTLADYLTFCDNSLAFVTARNERIAHLGL